MLILGQQLGQLFALNPNDNRAVAAGVGDKISSNFHQFSFF
jgi:hypothetical protein